MNPHHHWSNPPALHVKRPRPNQVDTETKLRHKYRWSLLFRGLLTISPYFLDSFQTVAGKRTLPAALS